VLDIQYYSQRYFFGRLAELYFENQKRDIQERRQRQSKYDQCYEKLPQEFTSKDAEQAYGISRSALDTALSRLCKRGYIERLTQGNYRKIRATLTS
jgi:predicted transcriptional regulator of viral defense system